MNEMLADFLLFHPQQIAHDAIGDEDPPTGEAEGVLLNLQHALFDVRTCHAKTIAVQLITELGL